MTRSGFWARGSTSGLFKSKIHKLNEVLDPNSPYALYSKALRMIRDIEDTTPPETIIILDKWIKLCCVRLKKADHDELAADIWGRWIDKRRPVFG